MTTSQQNPPMFPIAAIHPKELTIHGDTRIDNYFWLRGRENPDVIAYLEAENEYTKAIMKGTESVQQTLYEEMRGRIQETDLSVPEQIDDYFYYRRTEEGQQYAIYCRKKSSLDGPEEVLLDENELAKGHDYFRIGAFKVSPDHSRLAFSVDTSGGEAYTLRIKDLVTGELLPDEVPNLYYGLEWGNDNRTLFYNTVDVAMRPYKLFRHQLGEEPANDRLVFHEEDDAYFLGLFKTKDRKYLILALGSKITSECWFIPASSPNTEPTIIQPRRQSVEYRVEHHTDRFLIMTNDQALNFRVMEAPVDSPGQEHWREFIPHQMDVKIDYIEPFREHLVLYTRRQGLRQIAIMNLTTDEIHEIAFPEPVYTVWPSANPDFNLSIVRFTYESMTTPDTVYDYDMNDRTREQKKQKEVLGGYNRNDYESKRLFATASDGTQVPISLVHRKDTPADRPGPLLLYGYGSYGSSIDPGFQSNLFSLVDRGISFAIAHIRGGGEMGRQWYEDGKFLHKKNTFTDFIACAEHLIAEGYTTPNQLMADGRSAGGLLMGAITNMRPDLFKGIIAGVPFVDVVSTMLDPSIPLTVIEYEEWGNPNDPVYYEYMKSYSPYDNIEAKAYPNILATAGLNDPRVQYWEPAKWVAKLRVLKTDHNKLMLKTNMGAGHSGASGRFDYLEEVAFEYAFVLDVLGIEDLESTA